MSYNHLTWYNTFQGSTWAEVLDKWASGDIPNIPFNINKPFLWRTSPITKDKTGFFREEFVEDKRLKGIKQNYDPFKGKPLEINKNKEDVLTTLNLGKDSILIIPGLKKGKDFTNIFFFMKNASIQHQKKLWKTVVREANKCLKDSIHYG